MLPKLRFLTSLCILLLTVPLTSQAGPPEKALEQISAKSNLPFGVVPGGPPTWIGDLTASTGKVEYPYDPTMPIELTYTTEANRNIARYWNYRDKFRKEFMKLTTDQGGCLPAEEIIEYAGANGPEKMGHWGDATIKLGWYMGVLSTELHMLNKLSKSGKTKEFVEYGGPNRAHNATVELYCALMALERVDQFGETHLWDDHPFKEIKVLGLNIFGTDLLPMWPNQPGFFIRDDVNGNLALGKNKGIADGGMEFTAYWSDLEPFGSVASDENAEDFQSIYNLVQAGQAIPTRKLKQMSQDQAIHLIMGLGLVKRFVPDYVSYNGINLRHWAISKTEDIVDWISQTKTDDIIPPSYAWTIFDPVTPEIHYLGDCDPFCLPWFDPFHPSKPRGELDQVARGAQTYAYAQGINLAGYQITGVRRNILPLYDSFWQMIPATGVGVESFATLLNRISDAVGKPIESGSLSDNVHMAMAIGAISDGWGSSTGPALVAMSTFEDFYIYPLVNAAVYDKDIPFWVKSKIETMLRSAPYGGTTTPEPVPDQGWGSENRFIRGKSHHGGENTQNLYRKTFHGLDYMLLNNLYYIQYPEKFTGVIYTDDKPLPDLGMPDWPVPPDIKLPPIGYAAPEGFNVVNQCKANAYVQIPITVEYDDPHGDRDTVGIFPIQDGIGLLTPNGEKNKFMYNGPFWGNWKWYIHPGFRLIDEDNNSFDVKLDWSYPGAIQNPPDLGHVLSGLQLYIDAWWEGVPLWGRIEADYTIYAIDKNCWPWQEAQWYVVGMENVYAYKTGQNGLHVTAGVTLLQPHGSGKVTLLAVNPSGGPVRYYDIPLSW